MARLQPGTRITLAAIDRYPLPAQRSAAYPPHAAAAGDRCDRQTDGRTNGQTLDRCIDPLRILCGLRQ